MELEAQRMAERVRAELIRAALAAYEDAGVRGLCAEGAWEVAVDAMRKLELSPATEQQSPTI
ncbi:MAG: acetyltransferase [Gemmatimonadales bacterium]